MDSERTVVEWSRLDDEPRGEPERQRSIPWCKTHEQRMRRTDVCAAALFLPMEQPCVEGVVWEVINE